MGPALWLAVALAGWVAIGVLLAMALGRRGFDGFTWFLIGIVLGPMSLPIAWNCVRRDERLTPTVITPASASPHAGVDVIVGCDGSDASSAAIDAVVATLGNRLGRLTLATVVPFDASPDADATARALLARVAAPVTAFGPTLELVHGHPATALAAAAAQGGYDLLAVGTTGHGHAHLFGSAAKELAQRSPIPVFLTGQ